MYTVIGYGGTRAFRILWMLEEMGLPFQHERIMPFTDQARQRVPGGRLPALQLDDGPILMDSSAILAFLADRHGSLAHSPGTVERARQDAWVCRCFDALDTPLMTWTLTQRMATPEPALRMDTSRRIRAGLAELDTALAERHDGPWLMGNRFTFADIVLGHCLHWAERAEHSVSGFRNLAAYLDTVQQRPAYSAAESA